jgi:uncharacterized membrane protein
VDSTARAVFGVRQPVVVLVAAVVVIYLLGVFVTSLVGRHTLRALDAVLRHAPGLRDLYGAWKQVALTEGEGGVFARVALIPDEGGEMWMLGFTTGKPVEGNPDLCCVFVPASPNPMSGRLFFCPLSKCRFVDLPTKDAFKLILSGGNYVPRAVGAAAVGAAAAKPAP